MDDRTMVGWLDCKPMLESMHPTTDTHTNGRMFECQTNRWMKGWMKEKPSDWMDGWMDAVILKNYV